MKIKSIRVEARSRSLSLGWELDEFEYMKIIPDKLIKSVKLIRAYNGRVYRGWSVVEWVNHWELPTSVQQWINDNCAGKWRKCPIGEYRYFFQDVDDALMCYMAFS